MANRQLGRSSSMVEERKTMTTHCVGDLLIPGSGLPNGGTL